MEGERCDGAKVARISSGGKIFDGLEKGKFCYDHLEIIYLSVKCKNTFSIKEVHETPITGTTLTNQLKFSLKSAH